MDNLNISTTGRLIQNVVVSCLAFYFHSACAQVEPQKPPSLQADAVSSGASDKPALGKSLNGKTLQELYGGVVVDQTITVAGQNFYQAFVSVWRDKPNQEQFLIAVRERPSARWGNEVSIEYAQRRVYQITLPPNIAAVRSIATQAAEITHKNVVDTEFQRLLFRDPDIGTDEL